MSVPYKYLAFLIQIMQVEVAFLAKIRMFSVLQRIVQGHPLCVSKPASIAFSSPHSTLEHSQWIFVFPDWLKRLILCKNVHVLEDYDVVAALQMTKEIRSSEDHSQAFYLGLGHFVDRVRVFCFHSVFLEIVIGECDDLIDLLMRGISMEVEVILDEAIRVGPVDGFLALKPSNQAVELANNLKKSLLAIAEILVHLFSIDAVIQTNVDEWLSRGNALI